MLRIKRKIDLCKYIIHCYFYYENFLLFLIPQKISFLNISHKKINKNLILNKKMAKS